MAWLFGISVVFAVYFLVRWLRLRGLYRQAISMLRQRFQFICNQRDSLRNHAAVNVRLNDGLREAIRHRDLAYQARDDAIASRKATEQTLRDVANRIEQDDIPF